MSKKNRIPKDPRITKKQHAAAAKKSTKNTVVRATQNRSGTELDGGLSGGRVRVSEASRGVKGRKGPKPGINQTTNTRKINKVLKGKLSTKAPSASKLRSKKK